MNAFYTSMEQRDNGRTGAERIAYGGGLSDFKIVEDRFQTVDREFEACKRDR